MTEKKCELCGKPILHGTLCHDCGLDLRWIEEIVKTRAGRKRVWKLLYRQLPFAVWLVENSIHTHYTVLLLHRWEWYWGVERPKYQNWSRFTLWTPFFTLDVKGWLFWGKKPEE